MKTNLLRIFGVYALLTSLVLAAKMLQAWFSLELDDRCYVLIYFAPWLVAFAWAGTFVHIWLLPGHIQFKINWSLFVTLFGVVFVPVYAVRYLILAVPRKENAFV